MAEDLEIAMEREYQKVQKTREELLAKRAQIDKELEALDRRLRAAENYKATLEGRLSPLQGTRTPRAPSSRAPRGSREELRQKVIEAVKQHREGLVSDQINAALGATDPKQKQQIANVLSILKKDGVLHQEARRGPYVVAQ